MSVHGRPLHGRRLFWLTVVLPPAVWFANLSASYAFAVAACETGRVWPIYLSTFLALVLAGAALAFAHREWRRLGSPRRALDPGHEGSSEFLGAGARMLAAFFFAVIAVATLPPLLFGACL